MAELESIRAGRSSGPTRTVRMRRSSGDASKAGESEGKEHALRDPALFDESGKVSLFYSVCGEQGIGGADVTALIK